MTVDDGFGGLAVELIALAEAEGEAGAVFVALKARLQREMEAKPAPQVTDALLMAFIQRARTCKRLGEGWAADVGNVVMFPGCRP